MSAATDELRTPRLLASAVAPALVGLLYFLGAELGHLLAFHSPYGEFATYWPPSGLYLAAMLFARGLSGHLLLIASAVAANLASDVICHHQPVVVSLGFCLGNTLTAVLGARVARQYRLFIGESLTFRDVLGLALVSVACTAPASGLIGATTLWLQFGGSWLTALREWWLSVAVGDIVFFPLWWHLVTIARRLKGPIDPWRVAEGAFALTLLALMSRIIFHSGQHPVVYLTVPISLWLAVRIGGLGVAIGNVLLSVIAVWHSIQGEGPLRHIEPMQFRAVFLQVFNVTASLTCLALSAVVHERERALRERISSDERFRDLFDNVSDFVAVTDLAGGILFANRSWHDQIGLVDHASGQHPGVLHSLHPDDREVFIHVLGLLESTEVLSGLELRVIAKDGRTLDMEGSFSRRSSAGTRDRVRIIFRDVTARKVTATRLEEAHQQLEAANRQLMMLAATDGLTGLHNRRSFDDRLQQECHAAQRYDRALSLVLFDLDHFKSYNDTFGHPAGDDVLRSVARLVSSCIRDVDVAGRVGGEEFAVLLPETDAAAALRVAERIRTTIALAAWPLRQVTASVGVSTMTAGQVRADDLLEAADQALYQAKRAGRNQTVRSAAPRAIPAELIASATTDG